MEIPLIINDKNNNTANNINEKHDEKEKNTQMNNKLPFLSLDLEQNKEFPNISNKLDNAKILINSQTDKLLIEGFEGSKEDFEKCYHKLGPIKLKKKSNVKHRKFTKFLIRDGYSESMKLTKTKEFNLTLSKKCKLLAQFGTSSQRKYNIKNIKLKKMNRNYFNNLFLESSVHKSNQVNSSNTINDKNINNNSGSLYLFDKSDTGSINRNYGSTFYFYKKNTENQNSSRKTLKNRSLSLNSFITLRNILNDTTHNIKNINIKLKKYMQKKSMDLTGPNSTKNKTSRFFHLKQTKDSKLKELLDSFQKKEDKTLKMVKKDEGINSQNIWIKRTTANLLSFGKSFMNLNDNQFYLERKRIMEDYPKIEKEANINEEERYVKEEENTLLKQQKIKMEQNSRKMNDLNNVNNLIFNKLKEKIKEIKQKK